MSKKRDNSQANYPTKVIRNFSEELKKKIVEQLELKQISVRDVMILYKVCDQTVYNWKAKYSKQPKGVRMVVESESYETKVQQLSQRIAELEQAVGRKQLENEFLSKVVDIYSEEFGEDVKKKYITAQLSGSVKTSTKG
jgi:transposase